MIATDIPNRPYPDGTEPSHMSCPDTNRSDTNQKDMIMDLIAQDLARSHIRDLQAGADAAARARRLRAARRWARRAELAARRAARASAAVR